MKKSELRKIIKESIKELLTEQPSAPSGGMRVCKCSNAQAGSCQPWFDNLTSMGQNSQYTLNGTYFFSTWMQQHTVDGAYPQVGQFIKIGGTPYLVDMVNDGPAGTNYHAMTDCYGCNGFGTNNAGTPNPPYTGQGIFRNYSTDTNPPAGCGGPIIPSTVCDPSAWSNLTNWTNNWTNGGPFNSSNPNQPCTHICSKIQQWTNALTNAGPNQANQLQCKIDEGNNQASIHGCNC